MRKEKFVLYFLVAELLLISLICYAAGVSVEEDLTLTKEQKIAVDKFRLKMLPYLKHPYMKEDIYLVRWLRAKDFDLDMAGQLLLANLRWRKENKIDTIESEDWSDMVEEYPYLNGLFDKMDRPLATLNLGQWNLRKAVLRGKAQRYNRYLCKMMEEGTKFVIREQRLGKSTTQWVVIMNLDGFNTVQQSCPLCMSTFTQFINDYEAHFPGYADEFILINTPPVFQVVLDLIRPLMSKETKRALKIFGPDKKIWGAYLDRKISKSQRTVEFGGTRGN